MWEHLGAIVAVCALAFSIATTVLGVMQRQSILAMKLALAEIELKLSKDISSSKAEIEDQVERQSKGFGETAAAIRQKITEVEIWARDTFVRRDSFYKVTDDLKASLNDMGDKIEKRLDRMETKIDAKQPKGHT